MIKHTNNDRLFQMCGVSRSELPAFAVCLAVVVCLGWWASTLL